MLKPRNQHTGGFLSDKEAKIAEKGDLEGVKALLAKDTRYLNAMTMGHNRTLVWSAARKNRFEVVRFLVESGASLNIPGRYRHETYLLLKPYAIAKRYKRETLADYLLTQDTEIDIFTACYLGEEEIVEEYLANDPNYINKIQTADSVWEVTPIHFAIAGKQEELARLLIEKGAKVERYSDLLLEMAEDYVREDLVKILIDAGAKVKNND